MVITGEAMVEQVGGAMLPRLRRRVEPVVCEELVNGPLTTVHAVWGRGRRARPMRRCGRFGGNGFELCGGDDAGIVGVGRGRHTPRPALGVVTFGRDRSGNLG